MYHGSLQAFAAFQLRSGQWSFRKYRNRRGQHQNIRIRDIIDFRGEIHCPTKICFFHVAQLFINRHSYAAGFGSPLSAAAVELASAAYLLSSIPNATLRTVGCKDAIVKPKGSLILDSHPSGRRSSMRMDSRSEARLPNIVKIVEELQKMVEIIDRGGKGG